MRYERVNVGSKQLLEEFMRFISTKGLFIPVNRSLEFSKAGIIDALKYVLNGSHTGEVCMSLY